MVMEFVDGTDLCDVLHSSTAYTWAHVQDFVCDMASAMAHVHARGFLHRDLKATNFLVFHSI